jgi:hypothetical protein
METLWPFLGPAALFLVLELLWCARPAWRRRRAERAAERLWGRSPSDLPAYDPFALAAVQRRLGILAAELDRLDRDRTVFARAFRTLVAQAAYAALLDDAERLAAAMTFELEVCGTLSPVREEIEV